VHRKNLLIVDDDVFYLENLAMVLEDEYNVYKAKSLEEAKSILEKESIDVALVDVRLRPDSESEEGFDLLVWIKKNYGIPVIVMSQYEPMKYALKSVELGAHYFLYKPIDIRELKEILKGALSK